MTKAIRYNTKDQVEFQKAVRQAVDNYFKTTGQSTKANPLMYFKIAFFFLWMVGGYVLLFYAETATQVFIYYQIFGFGALFFSITVAHDASHQALFQDKRLNNFFSYAWNLIGMSKYFWELKHHESHHNLTNVIDYDSDISPSLLLRLNPGTPYHWFHRYQHLYVYFLYLIFGPFTVLVREFRLYTFHQFGNTTVQHPPFTLLRLVIEKLFYLGWALVLPVLLLPIPFWTVFAAFWFMSMTIGIYAIIILAIPHLNSITYFKVPNEQGVLNTNWYNHVLETTLDYGPKSRLLNWFSGGLNTHVPHHLFPGICHIHYYELCPVIEKVAQEYGVPYHKATLWEALKGHFALITELRLQDRKSERWVISG